MKMKFIDRLFVGLFSLGGICASLALICHQYLPFVGIKAIYINLRSSTYDKAIVSAITVALLLLSVKVLMIAFKRDKNKMPSSVSINNTEHGSVKIAVSALDTLISQTLEHQDGIKNVKSKVLNHEDSISIAIEMSLNSDVNIPNITMLLQKNIKDYIEEFSGIAVREVTVLISSIVEVVPLPLQLESKPSPEYETFEMPADSLDDAEEPATEGETVEPEADLESEEEQ